LKSKKKLRASTLLYGGATGFGGQRAVSPTEDIVRIRKDVRKRWKRGRHA